MRAVYKNRINDILEEVKKIFEENEHSQDIHICIDCEFDCVPTITFDVKNRFPKFSEGGANE